MTFYHTAWKNYIKNMHMKKKNGDLIYKAAHEIREAAGP